MKMLWTTGLAAILLMASTAAGADPGAAEAKLDRAIHHAIAAQGPLLTAGERALVERKCGYAPGSWNGENLNVHGGVLHCTNGRKVDDKEVRVMLEAAAPRISRQVEAAMARPEVAAAINAVAREASAEALRGLKPED